MSKARCVDCYRPHPQSMCGECKAARQAMAALRLQWGDLEWVPHPIKEANIERYAAMVERGEPLFEDARA